MKSYYLLWTSVVNASSTGCGSLKTKVIKDWLELTFQSQIRSLYSLTNISTNSSVFKKKKMYSLNGKWGQVFVLFFLFLEREEDKKVVAYLTNMVVGPL